MKYVLLLNDMRSSNIENLRAVRFGERQDLIDWCGNLRVAPWVDGQWHKVFKKGSELEWFNEGNFQVDDNYFGGVYKLREDITEAEAMSISLSKS